MQRIVVVLVCILAIAVAGTSAQFRDVVRNIVKDALPVTSKRLQAQFMQSTESSAYHVADLTFDTKIESLNPDDTDGITNVECTDDNKIILTTNNADSLKEISSWPDQVLLLLSLKWKCFIDDDRVQFFLVNDKIVDDKANKVTFIGKECDISEWSETFQVQVNWEKDDKPTRKLRRRGSRNRRRGSPNRRRDIDINKENKFDLDMLYDEKTGKSSMPNFPIVKLGQDVTSESVICANCYAQGEATLSLVIKGSMLPKPTLNEATVALDGNLMYNFDIKVNGGLTASASTPDFQIAEIPLSPLSVPGVFTIGPSIVLTTSASVSASVTGTYYTGSVISYPQFHLSASLADGDPNVEQSGFDAQTTQKPPSVGATVSGSVSASLKPQLALGVSILNGVVKATAGFELVATLDTTVARGSESGCNGNQTDVSTSLSGSIDGFVASVKSPSIPIGSVTIGEVCV